MSGVRGREHVGARRDPLVGEAVVHIIMRGEQADPAVPMLGVAPGEEDSAVRASILDRPEAFGEVRRYFRVLNCASEVVEAAEAARRVALLDGVTEFRSR